MLVVVESSEVDTVAVDALVYVAVDVTVGAVETIVVD